MVIAQAAPAADDPPGRGGAGRRAPEPGCSGSPRGCRRPAWLPATDLDDRRRRSRCAGWRRRSRTWPRPPAGTACARRRRPAPGSTRAWKAGTRPAPCSRPPAAVIAAVGHCGRQDVVAGCRAASAAIASPIAGRSGRHRGSAGLAGRRCRRVGGGKSGNEVGLGPGERLRVGEVVVGRAAGPGGPTGRPGRRCRGARCSAAHSAAASRRRRGRSSRPTRAAKVCSAGPPAARRRRNASARRDDVGQPLARRPGRPRGRPSPRPGRARSPAGPARPAARGVSSGGEDALELASLHRLRVGRVDPAHRLLDRLPVDLDALGVRLDGVEHVPAQPRHVAEEPLVGRLAQGHVEADLVLGDLQALAVRGDVGRDRARPCRPGRAAGRCRRRRAPRRRASRAPCRAGRRRRAPPSEVTIDGHRAELGPHLRRHEVAHRVGHPGRRPGRTASARRRGCGRASRPRLQARR